MSREHNCDGESCHAVAAAVVVAVGAAVDVAVGAAVVEGDMAGKGERRENKERK